MCGIAGFVGLGSRDNLSAMTSALVHRGPDDHGQHVDEARRVFLGFRRLSIVDIAGGKQPMWNEDDTIGIVYNGEIYNCGVLRAELERRGHRFRTSHSDTEVLVHGFEEWGEGLPAKLNGMFAFALYDKRCGRLFLARDRFGEKPLYYAHGPGFFAFASELSALTKHPLVDGSLSPRSVQKYFAYGYLPAPNTIIKGGRKLRAGSFICFDIESNALEERRYWQFMIEAEERSDSAEDKLAEELRHLLSQAVRRRLVSDVPLGLFLSGGIDSSTILALAACHRPAQSLETFTIGFTEPSFDESSFAREIAQAFGTLHRERVFDLPQMRNLFPYVLGRLDEPLGDASILPTYMLSAFARERVTVCLSGDGGDELFAGYDPFAALTPATWYGRLVPKPVHILLRRLVERLPKTGRNMSLDFKLRRALTGLSYPSKLWNPVWMAPVEPNDMRELLEHPLEPESVYEEAIELWDRSRATNNVDRTLEFFTNLYLQDDILTKVDRATMMVSLESRAVFLDNDVVEFCRRLPNRFKYRNGRRKYLLKCAMQPLLPPSVLSRPKKGFGIPLSQWLREVPRVPPLSPVPGINMDWVDSRWRSHRAGKSDERLFLWSWLGLQSSAASVGLSEQAEESDKRLRTKCHTDTIQIS